MAQPPSALGKIVLVVNPISGGGRGARVLRQALPIFRELGVEPDVIVTASGDEPAAVGRRSADEGAQTVVALGGDGHAAAVGEGLVAAGRRETAMAVLPAGSANDYARTIGMPLTDVRAAITTILERRTERVDAVMVRSPERERIFLNVVGTGFDAAVAAAAERITIMRGTGRYVLAIMRVLPRFKSAELILDIDGRPHRQRAMMIAIANGPAYGGGMRVAPDATLTSGNLEICIVGELSTRAFLRAFPRVFRGTHVTHPAVTMLRGREISIAADRPLDLVGDGERAGRLPATVSVIPQALSLVVGRRLT